MLTVCAGLIVCVGWYLVERSESYTVGAPSPRTYIAQSDQRITDKAMTQELRDQAADQVVSVRLRNEDKTKTVMERISGLRRDGNIRSFASPKLVQMIEALPPEQRTRIVSAAVDVALKSYDKAVNRQEQITVIWENLGTLEIGQAEKNIVFQLLDAMLIPTVEEDERALTQLRQDLSSAVPDLPREVRRGSQIVKEGQLVTEDDAKMLREQGYPEASIPWKTLAFVLLVTFFWSMWITWLGAKQEVRITDKEWIFVAVVLIINWTAQKAAARWDVDALALLATTGWIFLTLSPAFAFHVVLGGCLIGYILAFPGMTSVIAVGCILCAVASGASFIFVSDASSRIMIWRNIFSLGLCLTFTSLFIRWGFGVFISWEMLGIDLVFSAIWSSLVVAVLPLWETVFGMISPLRLLEMSHPSQPLLKRLQLEAPGTYHHTVSVATLAEAVADKLGMNGLLVKTGAFYHDIGKLKRPHYFVENQSFGDNIHDRLAPQESAKQILGHVDDGLKLADEYGVPEAVKDFIREHHGKTCLSYFYQKALNADKEVGGDGSSIEKSAYCYPGPNPQRPETALLMLADSVEAALKGVKNPIAGRPEMEKLVNDVVESKVSSGQFSDADFTLKDISAIKNAFVEVLMSMYHTREVKPVAADDEAEKKDAPVSPSTQEFARPARVKP